MHILLTGATGYIGQLLFQRMLEQGHEVTCCVRNPDYFQVPPAYAHRVRVLRMDFLKPDSDITFPQGIDVAYYLIHSMSASTEHFESMEKRAAENFLRLLQQSGARQIVYLSGIVNEKVLSRHLQSRFAVEQILRSGSIPVTVLRAGIIVGAGSASFELIRDLVEKLPVMITPKWLLTRSQPVAVDNVLEFLEKVALNVQCYSQSYDIGGEDIISYKEMLLTFARVRKLRRRIWTVPVMTPRLSSYWLYFVTSVSYPLAVNLVDSMKVEVICRPNTLAETLGIRLLSYEEAIRRALKSYGAGDVASSWKDALSSSYNGQTLQNFNRVPQFGVLKDSQSRSINKDRERILDNIWAIGGNRGWYYGNWLWKIRGFIDKLFGGVGLRRGRTHDQHIEAGDALDFWRVLVADREEGRLLLFAEMKLPGEAWLEFRVIPSKDGYVLRQVATFRPKGLWGRMYWYLVSPFHLFIFKGMINRIVRFGKNPKAAAALSPPL